MRRHGASSAQPSFLENPGTLALGGVCPTLLHLVPPATNSFF